ncbi:MAG: DUF1450 domain-containing protein [Tuberibacillus sp.]
MNPVIEFCMCNLAGGAERALEKLQQDSSIDVIEYTCLDLCDLCFDQLYALVNGEMISGHSPEHLVDNIYQHLKRI